jgi:ribulose-5-phosphate 4-epimerase/fuculose-1-phosphate aldolase
VTRRNLAHTKLDGRTVGSTRPTKEALVHLAIYANCPEAAAVLHVHPAHAVAASALLGRRAARYVPPMTPQFVMRAGRVSLVPYFPPGDLALAAAIRKCPADRAILLQNHGALAFAASPSQALGILEELEENCKVWLLSGGRGFLTASQERLLLGRSM